MSTHMRYGNKWNINELLALQREYELLEWSIQEIAEKHRRSVNAILFKLESEGFIASWNEARGFELLNYYNEQDEEEQDEEEQDEEEQEDDDDDYEEEEEDDDEYDDEQQNANEISIQDKYDNSIDENVSKLADRVWSLETSVSEIGLMVKQMFDYMVTKKTAKRGALRKY